MSQFNSKQSAKMTFYITRVALLAAIAALLMLLELTIPFFPMFYKLDFSFFPVIIAALSMGPIAGSVTMVLKDLIAFLAFSKFADSMGIGALADILIGLAFIIPAALIYKKNHTKKGAAIGLGVSLLSATLVGCMVNYWIMLPLYSKAYGLDTVLAMAQSASSSVTNIKGIIVMATLPFNLMKWVLISVLTILTYKPLSRSILKKPRDLN